MKKKEIPQQVADELKPLIDMNGGKIKFLGVDKGFEVYLYQPPKNTETGFPRVFIWDKNKSVMEVPTKDAFEYINLFVKD